MKIKTLSTIIFYAGLVLANAQSNPGSSGGVDTETELSWPDGTVRISSYNANDYPDDIVYIPYPGPGIVNWTEAGGGSAYCAAGWGTNEITWPGGGVWPELPWGINISLPSGTIVDTNAATPGYSWPGGEVAWPPPEYGSANYEDSYGAYSYNEQPQLILITGGAAGATGSELYGAAMALGKNVQPNHYFFQPQQLSISSFGNLNTNGWAFAALPVHSQFSVTPSVAGASFYQIGEEIQPFPLVSQCVATTPANRSRTTIGVGEQVNLSFSPTIPVNAIWSTTAGSLSSITNTTNQFTAPSTPGTATVTATVQGKSVSITYTVVQPGGIAYAEIIGTNHFSLGVAEAQMTNEIWVTPTNVSFYRVSVMEVGEDGTNLTGYYTQWTPQQLHHTTADHWTTLNQANQFDDIAGSGDLPPPWSSGGFMWNIPADWQVTGSGVTNSMNGWNQVFSIDSSGTVTVQKFGNSVTRTVGDVITTQ